MKRATWTLILAWLLTAGLGLQLIVTQPLERQINQLTSEVSELHRGQRVLADFRDDVAETNTLLGELADQSSRLQQVRADLANVRNLEQEVLRQSASADEALASLTDIARLQSEVIAQSRRIEAMTNTLDQLARYQQHADESMQRLESFHRRIIADSAGIGTAESQFAELIGLKRSVEQIPQSDIDVAQSRLSELDRLRKDLVEGGQQTLAAQQISEQLIALQNEIATQGNSADRARKHAAQLLNLEQTLSDDASEHIGGATQNLAALLHMEEQLASQTRQITQAVESLELMQDLQEEFHRRTEDLDGIRRGLTELVMLESLVARTVRSLKPLTELANLRRLDAGQIRSIAQSLLDQQTERVATNDVESDESSERLVPLPRDPQ